jgi:hypothetical protein
MHALKFDTIKQLATEDPPLCLRLYQVGALQMAKRFDQSKEQLAGLVDCLYAHTHVDYIGDAARGALYDDDLA